MTAIKEISKLGETLPSLTLIKGGKEESSAGSSKIDWTATGEFGPLSYEEIHQAVFLLQLMNGALSDKTIKSAKVATPAAPEMRTFASSKEAPKGQLSYAEMHDMIFELLKLIGMNQSVIAKATAGTQADQASIASKNADAAKVASEDVVKRLDELRKQNEAAAAWGIFGTVIKWLGVVLSAVISFVTANPTLFAMTLALVVLTESGAMGKLTEAIGSALVAAGCDPAWSNIVAELIVTVIVIVASLGTQAIASGANAASAGSRLAQAGAKASAGLTAAAKAIPLVTIQSLLSSAVLMELMGKIPGLDKIPALQILLTLILMIVATVVGAKTMNASGKQGTMLQTVAQRFNKEILQATQSKIEFATSVAQFGATTAEGISTTGKSVMEIQLSDILKKLAGDKNVTQILELISTAFSQYADKSVKAAKDSFTTYRPLFDAIPSFNKDMDAAAEALLNK
jgi:hypothetical protein